MTVFKIQKVKITLIILPFILLIMACGDVLDQEQTPFVIGDWNTEVTDSLWTVLNGTETLEVLDYSLHLTLEAEGLGIKHTNQGPVNFTWNEPPQQNPDLVLRGPGLLNGGNQMEEYFLEIILGSIDELEWRYRVDSTFTSTTTQDTLIKKRKLTWKSTPF